MTQIYGAQPGAILVTEGETVYLEINWTDRDGIPATPTAVEYGCYDARTGAILLAPTAATSLDSTMTIVVPPAGTACADGATAVREVALEIAAMFGTEKKTLRQVLYVQPMHMV